MTIIQTDSVSTTLMASSAGRVTAMVLPIRVSIDLTASPATFFDSDVLENASVESWNEYKIQAQLGSDYVFENLSACQSLTGNVIAPIGNGGFGRIRVTDGSISKILKCDTTKQSGQAFREFVQYSEDSISRYLYEQVEPLFDATPDVDYYSAYNHATGNYTRNANSWVAGVDLSCVAVASGDGTTWTRQRGGVLISPRHILIARHFSYGIGTQVRFSNAAGTMETRTVIGTSAASIAGDLWVCTLSAAVTVAGPCAIAGEWIQQGSETDSYAVRWYSGGLVIHIDQTAKIYAATLGHPAQKVSSTYQRVTIGAASWADFQILAWCDHSASSIHAEFAAMRKTPVSGDSGQPVFIIIDGDPVLLWVWTNPSGGTPAYLYDGAVMNALIAVSDANAGISTGYTVTVATDPTL